MTSGVVPLGENQENPALGLFHGKAAPVSPHCRIGRIRFKHRGWLNMIPFPGTYPRIPPASVLAGALEHGLTDVVVLGDDMDGNEFFACSVDHTADAVLLCLRAILKLNAQIDKMTKGAA